MKDNIQINPFYRFILKKYIYSKLDLHAYCSGDIKSTYHVDCNLQERKVFQPLIKNITKSSKKFFDNELIIACMWANVGDYNSKILRHNHIDHFATDLFKQRGVSGSFYLKKPKNSGNFIIDDKIINIDQGDILFFSPHLFHETQRNQSHQKRMVISFNGYLM
jgi:hypothetical protein